jgi:hypothetical protein
MTEALIVWQDKKGKRHERTIDSPQAASTHPFQLRFAIEINDKPVHLWAVHTFEAVELFSEGQDIAHINPRVTVVFPDLNSLKISHS